MKKGISGHTLVIVISLIVAMLGLVLLWIFLNNATEGGKKFVDEVGCKLCESMQGTLGVIGVFMDCKCG